MTDEYFYIEEISPNSSEIESEKSGEKKCTKAKGNNNSPISLPVPATVKKSQEIRLHEIEQQLEMAESRCNTLKGQVDYMKMLYNGVNSREQKRPAKTTQPMRRHLTIESGKRKRSDEDAAHTKGTKYQTEEAPSRDRDVEQLLRGIGRREPADRGDRVSIERDTNAAVKSINNIISGITNSVNRLTQLQLNIGATSSHSHHSSNDRIGIQTVKCSPRYAEQNERAEKPYQQDSRTDHRTSNDSVRSQTNKKKKKVKAKCSGKLSVCSVGVENKKKLRVTAKHTEKKTKLTSSSMTTGDSSQLTVNRLRKRPFGKLRTISSKTLLSKKSMNTYTTTKPNTKQASDNKDWKSDKLIELYHNSAVKINTGSEESIPAKKTTKTETKSRLSQLHSEQVIMSEPKPSEIMSSPPQIQVKQQYQPPLSPIQEQQQGIMYEGSFYSKNYELPTIASKMKQVAKNYFQKFNFKTIPFVAARSITPSHNLGVNIQQVLSIIKGKKPVAGISPTLAYNIELAANKLGSRPLSALVSNLGSRMYSNKTLCPLARKYPFSHLQEMAKEIPEETIDEINAAYDEETPKLPPGHELAAGDDRDPDKLWYTDKKKSDKCTCLPKQGVSFNDVYNTYSGEHTPTRAQVPIKRIRHKPWNENRRVKPIPVPTQDNLNNQSFTQSKCSQISKRERSLKEILKNLHDEFQNLNNRYEELKTEVATGKPSETVLQDIEVMERDLQNKEDEITMVMTLYKEVVSLKQQVRVLKTRASQSSVVVSPFINRSKDYRDLNAAGHLTKLLRHIQQFQDTLKKK